MAPTVYAQNKEFRKGSQLVFVRYAEHVGELILVPGFQEVNYLLQIVTHDKRTLRRVLRSVLVRSSHYRAYLEG